MHVVDRPDGVTVVDDSYNANPDSMRAALKALAVLAGRDRRSIAVLGRDARARPGRARGARRDRPRSCVRLNIGLTIVVGEGARGDPRRRQPRGLVGRRGRARRRPRAVATAFLESELRPGDVVLVKSSYGAGLWRLGDALVEGAAR